MPYVKTVWVNGVTAVAAPTMNNIEGAVEDATNRLDVLTVGRVLTYQFTGNLDATYAGEWDFVLPAGLTAISAARLVVRGKGARDITSAAGAASGNTGLGSSSTGVDGTHSHNGSGLAASSTSTEAGHSHTYFVTSSTTSDGSHWHNVDSHAHTLNSHTHTLTKAVNVSTTPTGVNVYIDNGLGYGPSVASGSAPVLIDTDIAASITATTDVKRIQITSTRLGMVDVVLMITAS